VIAGVTMVRARNADGTYKGDDPSTPDINEAWVVVNDTNQPEEV
jgi:hypothetical protein